jgi:germination protein M
MKRPINLIPVALIAVLIGACTQSTGGLGPVGSAAPSAEPSVGRGSPDVPPGTPSPSATPSSQDSPPPASPPAGSTIVRAYFHLGGDVHAEGLVAVLREVPQTQAVARAAMLELLAGPKGRELFDGAGISTAIPQGTELLGISIEGRVATVDLSDEFESGGGSASAMMRLAQVTYTLTQFPTVDRVSFKINGRAVTVFGSEGIVLDGPVARDDYLDLISSIWVDRPAWGAALNNPGRVSGLANVFEAQFHIAVLDNDGRAIFDQPVMATCGTGCWGTFDLTIAYDVSRAQWGALRAYNYSAADGSIETIREYPVWLTPAG